jgi:hypothetical protein
VSFKTRTAGELGQIQMSDAELLGMASAQRSSATSCHEPFVEAQEAGVSEIEGERRRAKK